jgi:superoxide dismutase, Cu-Zn family
MIRTVAAATIALLASASASAQEAIPAPMTKSYSVIGKEGGNIGSASFTQGPTGVLIRIELRPGSLSPGWHGLHLHAVGDCSDIGEFKRSGGHVGKIEGGHGLLNPDGPEAGDLPNIYAFADGSAKAEVFTGLVTLAQGTPRLLDDDGSALLIHESPDDQITQPIGGAGARVACAAMR